MVQTLFLNFKVFPAWKKLPNFYRDQPAVLQGLGHSQRNPEALAWLDCATTVGNGVCVTELYPLIPPALPNITHHLVTA